MNGDTPLHVAMKKERIGVVMFLMDKVENLNTYNNEGLTLLYLSIGLPMVPSALFLKMQEKITKQKRAI